MTRLDLQNALQNVQKTRFPALMLARQLRNSMQKGGILRLTPTHNDLSLWLAYRGQWTSIGAAPM